MLAQLSRLSTAISSAIVGTLPDRRVLERTILPFLVADDGFRCILFVGCRWYTRPYGHPFAEAGKAFWTIDADPAQHRHGAVDRHIIDRFEHVERHFEPRSVDAIVCNGVFGWGLDAQEAVEQALAASARTLRDGGLLIVGWNDTTRRSNAAAGMYGAAWADHSATLRRFERYPFPGLNAWRYRTRSFNRHVFDFFRKPDRLAS